jgi:hypothetical protein
MNNKSHEVAQAIPPESNVEPVRQIDIAMADERPAKIAIRELWLERARTFNNQYPNDDVPLYLTLSGAEARDIKLFAEHNIIELTEIGAISPESQHRVVAIEKDSQAVLTLQRQLPGLQIINQNFANIIAGESPLKFPSNPQHEKCCCAKIINLDFQSNLGFRSEEGNLIFPVFNWLHKISLLHAQKKPKMDWCLCLTLNATINQPELIGGFIQKILKENYNSSPEFEVSCRNLLGDEIQNTILSDDILDFSAFSIEENQKILMIFVPKKISSIVHNQNWHVRTLWNLCYGGNDGHAPMVSWVLSFEWDERAAATPQTVYRESLTQILTSARRIEDNGVMSEFN